MSDAGDGFDAIAVVVDWIDACKQHRLDDLLNLYDVTAPLSVAKAEAFEVDLKWKTTGACGWRDRPRVSLRLTH